MSGLASAGNGGPWLTGHLRSGDEVVSVGGRGPIVLANSIVDAAANLGTAVRASQEELVPGVDLLRREPAWIIPLSWEPPARDAFAQAVRCRAGELRASLRSACEFRHGVGVAPDPECAEDPRGYVARLRRDGVRRIDCWGTDAGALVLVTHGPDLPAPPTASALHVVPRGWVFHSRRGRRCDEVDVGWQRGA